MGSGLRSAPIFALHGVKAQSQDDPFRGRLDVSDILASTLATLADVLSPHGPAAKAAAHSYAPGDFSVHFFLQLAVILLACRVVGWLGQKFLAQPQVVGEMIAGVVLGPSLLGLLFPDFQLALFPKETKNILYVGSQLGVGLYMFLVGTTFKVEHFRAKVRSAFSVSLAGIVTPFLVAWAITPLLLKVPGLFAPTISVANATLFMGACIALTAFPMLARIINERGLQNTSLGTLSLTAGAFDDACSWCVLAIVLATFGGGPGVAVLAIGGGVTYALFLTVFGRKLLAPLGRMVDKAGEMTPTVMAITLMLFCLSAFLMDAVGIHAIFGGFMLGAVMPRGLFVEELKKKVEPVAVVLLLPMFFTYSGLNTRLAGGLDPGQGRGLLRRRPSVGRAAQHGHGHRRPDELARPDGADHHQYRPAEGRHRSDPVRHAGADGDRHHRDGHPTVRGRLRPQGSRERRTGGSAGRRAGLISIGSCATFSRQHLPKVAFLASFGLLSD